MSGFNLGDDPIRVARLEGLGDAVDEEIEVFHYDRPDQGVSAVRLNERGEDPLPA